MSDVDAGKWYGARLEISAYEIQRTERDLLRDSGE
jgi:hypothetical protein